MFKYNVIEGENVSTVVAYLNGDLLSADSTHPNYSTIVQVLKAAAGQLTEEEVAELFSVSNAVESRLSQLSVRVTVRDNDVYFDEEKAEGPLADAIMRFFDEGVDDWQPLVKFWEKLAANPNAHSRDQLYRWLATHDFTINEDGDIVGYKGVNTDLTSIHSGPGNFVDGVPVSGHVPNQPGTVISMARSQVQANPAIGCHIGLHVGTWGYARGFGLVVLEVHVSPTDVVSVPTDCGDTKMRCCRYRVIDLTDKPHEEAVVQTKAITYVDDEAYCDDCGMYVDECWCDDYVEPDGRYW